MNTSEKAKLTDLVNHIVRYLKSGILIIPDMTARKTTATTLAITKRVLLRKFDIRRNNSSRFY